jgi:hypothetical protein
VYRQHLALWPAAAATYSGESFQDYFHPCPYALRCPHAGLTIAEVQKRLVVAPPHYIMKVVDKDGVREVKKV